MQPRTACEITAVPIDEIIYGYILIYFLLNSSLFIYLMFLSSAIKKMEDNMSQEGRKLNNKTAVINDLSCLVQ